MNWDDLRLLLAVSRRGSFLQAGEMLNMAASTLSRRISRAEEAFGEPLVERSADGTRLTARGMALVEAARLLETELGRDAAGSGLSGRVGISAGEGFIQPVQAAIAKFLLRHPGCSVDFTVTPELLKLARNAADLALRTVHMGEPSLIYRKLPPARFGIFAAPERAASLPQPSRPDTAPMIDLLPPLDQLPHLRAARAAGFSSARFRVSSFTAQLEAVRAGHGCAVLPHALATGLVQPYGVVDLPPLEIYLATRPGALRQPHIRAFAETLRLELQAPEEAQVADR